MKAKATGEEGQEGFVSGQNFLIKSKRRYLQYVVYVDRLQKQFPIYHHRDLGRKKLILI